MRNRLYYIREVVMPLVPFMLLMTGGLGSLYSYGTGMGGRLLLALCLLILLAGITMVTMEEAQKSEFFIKKFGDRLKKKSKRHRRMGKSCPECGKIIHHRRKTCQHCSFEFPSKKHDDKEGSGEDSNIAEKEIT